jgi:hypothetical protein
MLQRLGNRGGDIHPRTRHFPRRVEPVAKKKSKRRPRFQFDKESFMPVPVDLWLGSLDVFEAALQFRMPIRSPAETEPPIIFISGCQRTGNVTIVG